ncbi:MAG: SUMF1/EgtB/PvdO family nonheme iron enzyme [Acidobacteriota bacterium]|nr:MAG: SUMF1/EgtB/PvdO family nonheme iron enzyme [Acidobacteriota bacterium]
MLGRIIGNYEVISQFGEGGMGELYLGRHTRLAREVIIKTIRTEDFSPRQIEHLRERLEREAFVQSQLDHQNIVRVYDFIASGETTCIVMEYVPGRDLRKMITRETGPIPEARALNLFKQVLRAIDFAHNFIYSDSTGDKHKGIIHRDLKPANILVTPDDRVKVTDFGIVKVRGVKGGTQMGFNPGTPEYMSPEQARGRELDQRSDIYSLGIVLYEMLTGHVPFEDDGSGTSDYEIRRGHIELPVPPLSKFYPGVSPEIEKIVFKALEKDPEDRYQTARQFLEVIEEYERTGGAGVPTGRMAGAGARQTVVQEGRSEMGRSSQTGPSSIRTGPAIATDPTRPQTGPSYMQPEPNGSSSVDGLSRSGASVLEAGKKSKAPLIAGLGAVLVISGAIAYWLLSSPGAATTTTTTTGTTGTPVGMISIPAGTFLMGREDGNDFEKPAHEVTVQPFLIDKTEITNQQFAEFVRQTRRQAPVHWPNGQYSPGEANIPVVNVSWYDARDYCEWSSKRLPTEEEWEYAARGRENLLYPYGNQWKPNFSNAGETGLRKPQAVGSYPDGASPFSVFDMAGNVAEWLATDYKPYPGSPARPDEGNKIVRGGSFKNPAVEQTATDRFFYRPNQKFDYIGFRCAKSAN